MHHVRQEDLPFRGSSHQFVGADQGGASVSVFLFNGQPGSGPGPHRHPYDEVQFIRSGRGRWIVEGVEFEGGARGLIENSWARRGGMEDRIEVYGEGGVCYADLHRGNALPTYSEYGYGYAVEKAPTTKGWSWPVFEELWNYGFPQEMHHFARCVRGKETPQSTGEDARVVMEVLYAGYASAGLGAKVKLPYYPKGERKPIDGWLRARGK